MHQLAPDRRWLRCTDGGALALEWLQCQCWYAAPADAGLGSSLAATALSWVNSARRWHMALGTVKFFNTAKGYGFIQPQGSVAARMCLSTFQPSKGRD